MTRDGQLSSRKQQYGCAKHACRDLVLRVEHFGSTAIPGANPSSTCTLIPSFERAQHEAVPKLEAEGWDYIWRSPARMMFIKVAPMVHVRTMFIWHHATTNCGRGCIS